MSRRRFVSPDTTRLELSDGDWIEVVTELNYAETTALRRAILRPVALRQGMEASEVTQEIDPLALTRKRMELYLTDWSFRDAADKPVPITPAALDMLDQATADEINDAIMAHEAAVEAKKMTGGASE